LGVRKPKKPCVPEPIGQGGLRMLNLSSNVVRHALCTHRGSAPKQTPLRPFLAEDVWGTVSIDITGPHPCSVKGNIIILTLVDHFSKWAEAIPLRNHTAPKVTKALFDHVFCRFGMPRRILSDQGAEFESILFHDLCELMN